MSPEIKSRLFIVGCPRSGTTLLQSLMAAHPEIASFPESYFFQNLNGSWPWGSWLGIASSRARTRFNDFLHKVNQEQMCQYLPKFSAFQSQYSSAFVKVLDTITQQQSKSIWLEKTPQHMLHIDLIEKLVKDAKFIHIIRNGEDNVASLYDWALKYPEKAWSGLRDIDQSINLWTRYVETSRSHLHKPNHILVSYERLVEARRSILIEICEFVGIDFDEMMLQQYTIASNKVVAKDEPWKASVSGAINNTNGTKFYKHFNEEQRQYIIKQLASATQKSSFEYFKAKLKKILKYKTY